MKVILENKQIHGVPLIECYTLENIHGTKENHLSELQSKELLFFNHGFLGAKENFYQLMIDLARIGFLVVGIDAYCHGERIDHFFQTASLKDKELKLFDVVQHTGKDIQNLFEKHYKKDFEGYHVMGISLGGMVGFYTTSISRDVKGLVSIIGTPTFEAFVHHKSIDLGFDEEEKNALIESIRKEDPIHHMDHFETIKLLMLIGDKDDIVPSSGCRVLYDILVDKGINHEVKLLSYEVGHEFDEHMKNDLLAWCVESLL
jgi:uncharacterized protein